jgi:peroxiredoxin
VAGGNEDPRAGFRDDLAGPDLVRRVAIGVQEQDRDRLHAHRREFGGDVADLILVERNQYLSVCRQPFVDFEPQRAGDERLVLAKEQDVWGISPQGTASKGAFREKYGLTFPLLADETHAVAEAYGSWVEKQNYGKTYWGTARTTFIVDPEGRIARTWPKVKPEGHAEDVLAAIDALRSQRG